MFNAYFTSICQLNLQLTNWGSSMSFLGLHHAQVEINLILILKFYQSGTFFTFLNIFNVFWNVLRVRCFRVILKHILVFWRHFSLNIIKSSCCWSLFRLFDIGRQTLIWLKFKKSHFEIEIYTMNIIPLSNVIELNIGSLNWILFRETIIDNDIKTSFFRMSHCHMQQY